MHRRLLQLGTLWCVCSPFVTAQQAINTQDDKVISIETAPLVMQGLRERHEDVVRIVGSHNKQRHITTERLVFQGPGEK